MKSYKNIFFDLDRTLWDFDTNALQTFKEIYESYELFKHFSNFTEFYDSYKAINDKLWEKYRNCEISKEELSWKRFYDTLKTKGICDEEMSRAMSFDYINKGPEKTALFPDTIQILEYLQSKYSLYIVTNGFKEVQYKKMSNCKLESFFKKIFVSEEVGYNKPDKRFFEHVLKQTKATAKDSLIIGDDLKVDIEGAKNCMIDSVWLNTNNSDISDLPNYIISELQELKSIL